MDKADFLAELKLRLSGLPQSDREERLLFYREMIDDRMEEGLTEEALAQIGTVDEIADQITAETPLSLLVAEKARQSRGMKPWEILLLALGSPVWVPLLIAALAVGLSLYAAVWAVMVSLWAVVFSLAAGAAAGVFLAAGYLTQGNFPGAAFLLGAGAISAGLGILLFFGCWALTKGWLRLTKRALLGMKELFMRKERADQ